MGSPFKFCLHTLTRARSCRSRLRRTTFDVEARSGKHKKTAGIVPVPSELDQSYVPIAPVHNPALTEIGAASLVDASWMSVESLVKQLSEYVTRSLPGFWRIGKACMDGKYCKVSPYDEALGPRADVPQRDSTGNLLATQRPVSTCRTMALEIIKLYISTLSQFFTLSDVAIAEAAIRKDGEDPPIPAFVPSATTVIAACYFAEKLVEEVTECASELIAVDIGNEAGQGLRAMLDWLRWRFEEVIAATWARGRRATMSL